tara:strand:- start:102 stop:833 length:732 start_codon:yes stop_codon:yes gene_type:complete
MGFSGGGTSLLKAHKHTSAVQDGGKLDMDNVTEAELTQGDVIYSDGNALQRLGIGAATNTLVVNGAANAPEWAAAGASGKLELLTSSVLTGTASEMASSFTSINGADLSSLVVMFDTKTSVSADFRLQISTGGSFITGNYYSNLLDTLGNATASGIYDSWLILNAPDSRRQAGDIQIYIADSTQTASTADALMMSNGCDSNAEGQMSGGSNNASTYSIDGVRIYPVSGSLQVGSRLAVYKKAL